jgi:hypothetical protein
MTFEEGDISQMDLSYEPESEVEESEDDENVPLAELAPLPLPLPVQEPQQPAATLDAPKAAEHYQQQPNPPYSSIPTEAPPTLPKGSSPVEGFQLVQATGLTDTSTPLPKGSEIPTFATATPIPEIKQLPLQPPAPAPIPECEDTNPFLDGSKSKQFKDRSEFMIAEFFSRQVGRLTRGAPSINKHYR